MAENIATQQEEQHLSSFCPRFHTAVEIIGRRWSGVILRAMLAGSTRYTDIACSVPKLSDRLLSERLKEFEQAGIVERIVIPDTPVRVEYHLTQKGAELEPAFQQLADWAEKWIELPPLPEGVGCQESFLEPGEGR
ncbi:winged helix-turn-helix transcriptional regulator [Catenulispora pinisilvae]|uniref:winged helix-turn-helix transcriptional regulator n=1 Tax=Catenulispora pinisilvae TaxID=2705253 RepID=UPI001891B1C8|nr:helix-turn-helix domain-containing protein [Catenulispora pinisilvae]